MPCEIVVVLGHICIDYLDLDSLVARFGCSLRRANGIDELVDLSIQERVAIVLLDANTLKIPWNEALKVVRKAASSALPIVCHRFSEKINWPELADAGAYHALPLPLNLYELRQSLGFALVAMKTHPTHMVPLRSIERETRSADISHRVFVAGGTAA